MPTGGLMAHEEIDLRLLVGRMWLRRRWILANTVLFAAVFVAVAFLMTPIYRATTVVVDASMDRNSMGPVGSALGQLGGLASLAGIEIGSGGSRREESMAVLRSREFTERFIRDQNLMPALFAKSWDPVSRQWKGPQEDWPTLAQGFRYFDRKVRTVSRDKLTGLISIEIEWPDAAEGARLANALIEQLNDEMRARAIESTKASVGYLQKELEATSAVETRQAINRLMEAQINQRMLANVTEEYAFRVVDRALPPDRKDVVRPNKLLLLLLGPVLGLIFGALITVLLGSAKPHRG